MHNLCFLCCIVYHFFQMLDNYDESIQDLKRLLSTDRNNTAAKKEFEAVLRLKQQVQHFVCFSAYHI